MAESISVNAWKGRIVKVALGLMLLGTAGVVSGFAMQSPTPQKPNLQHESELVTQGRLAFERNCAACHAKGPSEGRVPLLPGTFALSLKYRDDKIPAALEDRTDLTPEYIETVVRHGIFSMPPLGKTDVSDQELIAIGAYFRESSKNPNGPIRTGPNKVIDR